MAARKSAGLTEVFQIKVTLKGMKPPIWRRLLVRSDMTMGGLHEVLQVAMGWFDCHLHEFRIGERAIGPRDIADCPGEPPPDDERRVKVREALKRAGVKAQYTYDFGDSWEHELLVEKVLPLDPEIEYPVCTGGKRAGPPEDCGGAWGYGDLVDSLKLGEADEETLELLGEGFDPEAFSGEVVNEALRPQRKRRSGATG